MNILPYDPGVLPTKPAIGPGDVIMIEVASYPPYKDEHFSIRNPKHKFYRRFVDLRSAGISAMDGRAWSHGAIRMNFTLRAPALEEGRTLLDYAAGIEDTLDGSSGQNFTYLPVVFEDDCQICEMRMDFVVAESVSYAVEFEEMSNK